MQVEFRKLFYQDLRTIQNRKLQQRIQSMIEAVESASSLADLQNIKAIKPKDFVSVLLASMSSTVCFTLRLEL